MRELQKASTRLYVITARQMPRAVIFRRGPSKHVRLISWNMSRDTFELGQWFKGRIYERRCDLSPRGEQLIYFASNFGRTPASWTAVSRPPYFTALLMWPKGDAWGGGGHFLTSAQIGLNHSRYQMKMREGDSLPKGWRVDPVENWAGRGEDSPLWHRRLLRDGWQALSAGKSHENVRDDDVWITLDPAMSYSKKNPSGNDVLTMEVRGIKQRQGPWYVVDHHTKSRQLPNTSWADWADNGDLLYARDGCLYRNDKQIADFSDQVFENIAPPQWALTWRRSP